MENIISGMLGNFERGRLSRRELVEGLAALALVGAGGSSAARAAEAKAVQASGIHHVSILVEDLERSANFYKTVFGLSPVGEDRENKILRLGANGTGNNAAIVSLRQEPPAGTVDHFAFRVDDFDGDRTTQALQQHGLDPKTSLEFGYYVRDPDNVVVQLV